MMGAIADLYVRLSADTSSFRRGLEKVGQDINRTENNITRAGGRIAGAGKKMTMGVTVPTVALGAAAVKMSLDFESAFAGVEKTVNGTEQQMGALRQGILDMATEIPASREEIAGVAEAAGQLGIQTPNILGFTRVMIDMGQSTNLASADAATALARFANITQMSQGDFDRLGSVIVGLGNNFATTESEIVEFGLRLAGAGQQIGLSEGEILAFGTALSSVGINAEAGGTAFSKVFKEIQLEVETGGDKLHQFAAVAGMSVEEFSRLFRDDAAAAIVAFVEGLGTTEQRGMSAIAVLEDMGITEQRVSDALLRAAGAGDLLNSALDMQSGLWEDNSALADEAAKRYDTNASKMKIAMNQITESGRQVGDVLVPMVAAATGFVADLAGAFASLPGPVQGGAIAVAAAAAAMGPLMWVTGSLIQNYQAIKQVAPQMAAAVANAFRSMATSHPILLGLTAATAALVAAWSVMSGGGRDNTRVVNELTDAMREQNDVVGESTRAWLLNQFQSTEFGRKLIGVMADAGISIGDMEAALAAGGPELDAFRDRLLAATDAAGMSGLELDALSSMLGIVSADMGDAAGLAGDLAEVEGDTASATDDLTGATGDLAGELDSAESAAEAATAALDEWVAAQRAAVDPLFALLDATRGNAEATAAVADAQTKLNETYASGDPAAIAEAQRDLERAHQDAASSALDLDIAEQSLLQTIKDQPGFLQQAIEKIDGWVASGRITADTADVMRDKFTLAALAAMAVPDKVSTDVQVTGVENAVSAIGAVIRQLQNLAVQNALSAVTIALQGRAAGGPVSAMTPYLVGEHGPEIVVPGASGAVVPSHQLGAMFQRGLSAAAAGGDGAGLGGGAAGGDPRAIATAIADEFERRGILDVSLDGESVTKAVGKRTRQMERGKR